MNLAEIDPNTLPSLPLVAPPSLPDCPAIYFVMQGDRVLYIGKTLNLAQRWVTHDQQKRLLALNAPVRIAWLECSDPNLLTQIETALIKQFKPELNETSLGNKREDPNYSQVSGYIPKEIALRFKIACTGHEITQSEALEEAVLSWIEKRTKATKEDRGKAKN